MYAYELCLICFERNKTRYFSKSIKKYKKNEIWTFIKAQFGKSAKKWNADADIIDKFTKSLK
jgi:hypothetical protein